MYCPTEERAGKGVPLKGAVALVPLCTFVLTLKILLSAVRFCPSDRRDPFSISCVISSLCYSFCGVVAGNKITEYATRFQVRRYILCPMFLDERNAQV